MSLLRLISGRWGSGANEFILKPNTKYVVSVETFADVYVTFHLDYYEHTNKH